MSAEEEQSRCGYRPTAELDGDAEIDERALSAKLAGDETQERLVDAWLWPLTWEG
ncbi:hypothetical protein JK358_22025 [Nocardia sp. 2]|uniref:Uncharacterized protein n=1 Tax=Nocardia acididurans TaxID=2802282 RepID=A0ABS1MAA2_9NOCA|nr:hypothetical protein [Nocardia acididurans]MBL1077080.1 hypothetical protein [Nocardia acididurans]